MKIIAVLAIVMLGTMNASFSMTPSQLEAEIILDARYLHTAVKLFEIEMLQTPASKDAYSILIWALKILTILWLIQNQWNYWQNYSPLIKRFALQHTHYS